MSPQTWWYLSRASGIVAWALLVASVLWGVLLSTRILRPHDRPAWLLDLHRWLGGLALATSLLHVGALVADGYVDFGAADVLVPFASGWKPLATAIGIGSLYLLAGIELTSLALRRMPRRVWHAVHLGSYGLVWMVSIHAGLAGSDVGNRAYQAVALVLTAAPALAVAARLRAGGRGGRRRPRPSGTPGGARSAPRSAQRSGPESGAATLSS